MRVPISKRLLCCASFVPQGARVIDVGTDHGYLGIYLLCSGIAGTVLATDLREKPLQRAMENAARFGTAERMQFRRCDGLRGIGREAGDTVICAGMGGDLIVQILSAAPWVRQDGCRLILQPQSGGQALREWLCGNGFRICRETLVRDHGFLYTVLEAQQGEQAPLTPGQTYVSPQLLASGSPLLGAYLERIAGSLAQTVQTISAGGSAGAQERLRYFETALREVQEVRRHYDDNR